MVLAFNEIKAKLPFTYPSSGIIRSTDGLYGCAPFPWPHTNGVPNTGQLSVAIDVR